MTQEKLSDNDAMLGRTGGPVWSNNTLGIFHAQQVEGGAAMVWVK